MAGEYVLSVVLSAQNKANGVIANFVSSLGPVGIGVAAIGAAALGVGIASTKMAADYQSAMTQLQNTTNSSDADMLKYKKTIRSLSDETGKSQADLAKGMYQIISANFAGADANRILATATRASIIANADQTQVTTGLVVTLNAFNLKASQADTVSNQMFKTLSLGRGNMSDLAGALQTGAALVAHYGVSVTDMDATLATLSTGGMKTFGVAMTATTQLLNIMDGKTDLITKRMHKLGIAFDEPKFKAMDYQHQLAYLNEALKGHEKQMVSIFGSKQAATALGILATQSKLLASSTKQLSDVQELAKEKQKAWANVQGTFNFQMQKVLTTVNNLMIDIGLKLLPIFTKVAIAAIPLIQRFGDWLIKSGALTTITDVLVTGIKNLIGIISTLVDWGVRTVKFFKDNEVAMDALKSVLIAFALVVAPLVMVALEGMAVAAWAAITPLLPFVLAIAVLALAVFGIIELMKNWGNIMDWLTGKTKQSMLEQGEAREKARIKAINEQEAQKKGVLKHLEAERTEAMNKLKTMANGYAKNREKMRLDAINNQIATTNGDIKELDKEKAQHLKALQDLQKQDPQYRERTKIDAINKQREQKLGILKELDDEKRQLLERLANEKNASDKARDQMKLHAVNDQIATTQHNIKELDKEKTQHATKLHQLVSSDLEARKNWYDRANDSVTAWFDTWKGILNKWYNNANNTVTKWFDTWKGVLAHWYNNANDTVTKWFDRWKGVVSRWVQDSLNHAGQMKDGFLAKLGQLKDQAITKAQQTVRGIANFFMALPGQALQWGANLLQSFTDGIASKVSGLLGTVSNAIQGVKNLIGFHSPAKTGPGSDADTWAVNLMKMYIHGIQGGLPGIKVAVNKAAELMKAGFTGDANALYQKINVAEYQLYLDKRAAVDAKYRQREAKHYDQWLATEHKRYEKYLEARQKALDKYNHEKHHRKAFHYHDFKIGHFKALKETLPKFTGLALGAFANQTNMLDPDLGNGAPMALPASQTSSNRPILVDSSVHITVHGSVVDHTKLVQELEKHQDKRHRMQGVQVPVTSGGRAR